VPRWSMADKSIGRRLLARWIVCLMILRADNYMTAQGGLDGPMVRTAPSPDGTPRVLLVGYNGANNTGSEARLLRIIEDVRAVFGPDVRMTVPTLNEKNLRRYLKEGPNLRIAPIPSIYLFALRRLVWEHDLVMLVEGSCYMDTWTSALLWAFLSSTKHARAYGKASVAYAVDAGELTPSNAARVRREASKTDLIITRTNAAAQRVRELGVTAPVEVTADTAFEFEPAAADSDFLRRDWPQAEGGVAGLSVMDFYLWPVVIRPFGRREHCYKWPYYFSRSSERCRCSLELAAHWAAEADRIVERHGKSIALIAMEELDEPLARAVWARMKHTERARIYSSRAHHASEMTALLRGLDLLITSRYHAGVLSLAARVPQVALGHDPRLSSFHAELGIRDDCFVESRDPDAWRRMAEFVDRLMADPEPMRQKLASGNEAHVERARRNRTLLREFSKKRGWVICG
jgi:polysaccharide pyruvyl transferase WcaK-like protein